MLNTPIISLSLSGSLVNKQTKQSCVNGQEGGGRESPLTLLANSKLPFCYHRNPQGCVCTVYSRLF